MLKNLTKHEDFLPIIIIFLIAVTFFLRGFLQNQIIWGYDTPKIIFPLIHLLDESFKHLQLPLWTPEIYFGFPIGGDGQLPWYYPASILHIFLPLYLVVSILSVLHVFLAGLFTYFFALEIKLSRFASVFAGIVFMFNGFIIAHMQYFSHIYAYAYLPLILLLVERAISKKNLFYFMLAGVAFGLQLLSGHPNIPIMTIIYVSLYVLLRSKSKVGQFFTGISTIVGIALVVALPYILYTLRLIPLSIRGSGVDFADATNSSFSFFDFVTFIFPNFFFSNTSNTWTLDQTWHFWSYWGQIETIGYVGILTLFFVPFAILKRTLKSATLFFILLFVSLILALGKNTVLYNVLFNTPIFNGLRAPGRFLYLVDFSLVILAGFGITALFQETNLKRIKINLAIILAGISIFAFVIVGSFLAKFHFELIYNFLIQNYSKLGYVANIESSSIFQQMVLRSFQDQTRIGLTFVASSTILILVLWNAFKNYLTKFLILVLIIEDLFIFSSKVNVWKNFDQLIIHTDPIINKLETELNDSTGRVFTFSNSWSNLMPDQLIPNHIPEANGFVSLPLKRFENWQREAESEWIQGKTNLFKIGSIKYLYDKNNLIAIDNPLPRAYIANAYISVKDESESFKLLTKQSFGPNIPIIESDNSYFATQGNATRISPVQIEVYQPQYIKISSNVNEDGLLVLTDTNFPGWEAYLNGKKVPIYQTNYLFRGIRLTAGTNIVEFKYQPAYLNTAFLFSGITIFMVLFLSAKKLLMR